MYAIRSYYDIGSKYLKFAENKKEYKKLLSWIDYGDQLAPGDSAMEKLRADVLGKKWDTESEKGKKWKRLAYDKYTKNGKNRITSYNVCYTKLLRGVEFLPEELAVGGVDLILKSIHQPFYITLIHLGAILHPEIGMGGGV